ncbi:MULTISPECIES: hypothetical protein [unclassified Mesorhizobium]|uniref:hypothetical protein n=1 Tax=unclassified Mesorhizobium TaxID=325217 RepID=UPI001FCD1FA6|nr:MULTISPECIES: hypothetical protein [unclassified Mesorhizobium]
MKFWSGWLLACTFSLAPILAAAQTASQDTPPADTDDFRLKVIVRDGDAEEHFWVMPFYRTADGF